MPQAVIFDVDGTLVDSVDQHAHAWVDAFRDYGHELAFEDVRSQIGKGGDQFMPVFLNKAELEEKGADLAEHRSRILKKRYLSQITGFPKVRKLFKRLQGDGKRVVLASSAKANELETYKKLAGIGDLIDTETSADDAQRSKPSPDIFLAALEHLEGIRREDVLVVGDTPYDAEAAGKAGLRTVGVLCGGFSEQSLRDAGCIAIYKDPADLLAQYDRSPLAEDGAAT